MIDLNATKYTSLVDVANRKLSDAEYGVAGPLWEIFSDIKALASAIEHIRKHNRELQSHNTELVLDGRDLRLENKRLRTMLDDALESSVVTMTDAEAAEALVSMESKLEKAHKYIETLEAEVSALRSGAVPHYHLAVSLDD